MLAFRAGVAPLESSAFSGALLRQLRLDAALRAHDDAQAWYR
jgi:hypothetical protein